MANVQSLFHIGSMSGVKSGSDYSFKDSQLRLSAQKFLKLEDYQKLIQCNTKNELYHLLKNDYNFDFDSDKNIGQQIQAILKNTHFSIIKVINNPIFGDNKPSIIKDYFSVPLDIYHLKVVTKLLLEEKPLDNSLLSSYGYLSLSQIEKLMNKEPIAFTSPYIKIFFTKYAQQKNLLKTLYDYDIFWDKILYHFYSDIYRKLDSDILNILYSTQVDMKNILTTLRLKHTYQDLSLLKNSLIEGGSIHLTSLIDIFQLENNNLYELLDHLLYSKEIQKGIEVYKDSQNYIALEKYFTEFLLKIYHRLLKVTYAEDLAILYSWIQKQELINLQTIIVGKNNQLSSDWVLSQIRVAI